jgi:ribose/xylose/arabinose/galactoside ABC-type transport system permease subunit
MAQTSASEIEVERSAPSWQWLEAALAFIARYREASIAAVAVLLVVYIQINNSVFLSSPLMSVVLRDTARIGLIAVGIVLVMITGEIDLSVGATFAMAPYAMIRMSTDWGWSLWLTAPVAILLGVAVGFANGFITVKLRIPSLITTLGTFFLLTGLTSRSRAASHPDAGATALQPGLRPESIWSARSALLVGRSHRLHTDHLDIGNRADPDRSSFPAPSLACM